MPANASLLDSITTHTINLDRVGAGLRAKIVKQLRVLESDLIKQLEDSRLASGRPMTAFRKARLTALLTQTQATISTAYGEVAKSHHADIRELAGIEKGAAASMLNKAIGADVVTVAINGPTITRIVDNTLIQGAPSRTWWSRQAGDTQKRFSDTVRQGLLRGDTTDDIVRAVRGTRARRYQDGALSATRRNAEALVRSSVHAVANEARRDAYRDSSAYLNGMTWLSTLDGRTSIICKSRSGLQYTVDGEPIGHSKALVGPPAHWNCRSTLVPILKSWAEMAGPQAVPVNKAGNKGRFDKFFEERLASKGFSEAQIKAATRNAQASMDGVVDRSLDYETWLKGKSEAFQLDVLGQGRYELWKANRLSFSDLTDNTGRPLTLAELRARSGWTPPTPVAPTASEVEVWHAAAFETSPDVVRQVVNNTPIKLIPPDPEYGAYHLDGGIHMGTKYETDTLTGRLTWGHETGHAVDLIRVGSPVHHSEGIITTLRGETTTLVNNSSVLGNAARYERSWPTQGIQYRTQANLHRVDKRREELRLLMSDKSPAETEAWFRAEFSKLDLDLEDINSVLAEQGLGSASTGAVPVTAHYGRLLIALQERDAGGLLQLLNQQPSATPGMSLFMADFFGAVTKNRVGWGHSKKYYEQVSNGVRQEREAFANAFLAMSRSNPAWATMLRRIAPKSMAEMDRIFGSIKQLRLPPDT